MAGLTQELEGGLAASFSFFDAAFEGRAFLGFAFDRNLLLDYDNETCKKLWDRGDLAPISDDGVRWFSFLYDVDNKTN